VLGIPPTKPTTKIRKNTASFTEKIVHCMPACLPMSRPKHVHLGHRHHDDRKTSPENPDSGVGFFQGMRAVHANTSRRRW